MAEGAGSGGGPARGDAQRAAGPHDAAETLTARLFLPAAGSTTATVEAEPHPRARRTTRALLILVVSVLVAPAAFLVPPHLLWPVVVLSAGGWFAWREWRGEYVIRSFEGTCPRCGEPLTLEPGSRVRARHRIECYGCHREPELILEEGAGV